MPPLRLTCDECRRLDREAIEHYGIPGMVLMENAGRGVADRIERLGVSGPVLICCGKGNNAGDGFVIARHLDLRGVAVCVLLWSDPDQLTGDAAANYRIIERAEISVECFRGQHEPAKLQRHLDSAAWIVDALLGTGAQGDRRFVAMVPVLRHRGCLGHLLPAADQQGLGGRRVQSLGG